MHKRLFSLGLLPLFGLATSATLAQTPAPSAPPLPQGPPPGAPRVEAPPSAGQSLARQLNEAFIAVFDHVAPAVVVVDVSKEADPNDPAGYFGGDFFNFRAQPEDDEQVPNGEPQASPPAGGRPRATPPRTRRARSEGSGFIFQGDGFILTNNHVVTGGSKIDVRLKDGRTFAAKLVGADEKTDIAVLKVDARDLPTVEFTDSDTVRVGQLCFAIGVPFKQDYSFTQGVVSAKNRDRFGMATYEDYIQTDASINPGNSGGPLLDLDGHVIGMNTLINGLNRGLGFAIPANMLRDIGGQLIKNGRVQRPYLGIRIETVTEAEAARGEAGATRKGVRVALVAEGGPASRSDLRQADVVTEVDGVPVGTDRELQKQVLGKRIGQKVELTVVRRGKTVKVPITTAELPGDGLPVAAATPATPPAGGSNPTPPPGSGGSPPPADPVKKDAAARPGVWGNGLAGLTVEKLSREVAISLGLVNDAGIIVTEVAPDSIAAKAGVRVRDVITDAGDRPVNDPDGLRETLRAADPRRGVDLYIARGGVRTFVVLKGGN